MKNHRIWAILGLVLIIGSIVCMMVGMFVPTVKDLLMQVSFLGFLGAAGVLAALSIIRKRAQEKDADGQE